jgi:hypothetical protein
LNVIYAGGSLDSLECIVDSLALGHFFLHLFPHEGVPQFVEVQSFSHFKFRHVLVLVGSSLSNLCVAFLAFNPSVYGFFLVFDAFLQLSDAILAISLFFADIVHQTIKDGFGLQFFFLGLAHLLSFDLKDAVFAFGAGFLLGRLDAGSDKVLLHALNHVSVGGLGQGFLVDLVLSLDEGFL